MSLAKVALRVRIAPLQADVLQRPALHCVADIVVALPFFAFFWRTAQVDVVAG